MTDAATLTDFITGRTVPDVGAEANRQAVERLLVTAKGYAKSEIRVDAPITVMVGGEAYRSRIDLLVQVDGKPFMAVKCAAGSLGSREREIVAAARVLDETRPVPLAVVSDGKTAVVLESCSGKKRGEGLEAVPEKAAARQLADNLDLGPLDPHRLERERIVFRSYDMDNVNVVRNTDET